MAKYDNREDQRISPTHRTATSDAPWSFLLDISLHHQDIILTLLYQLFMEFMLVSEKLRTREPEMGVIMVLRRFL